MGKWEGAPLSPEGSSGAATELPLAGNATADWTK
jgi:hypothetical protein